MDRADQQESSFFSKFLEEGVGKYSDLAYPKVSLVIPTWNASGAIGGTLESVLNQDYPDFEVIVVDASSKDRTWEIISSFKDPRIRIYSVTSYNLFEMFNKGISHSLGLYLNFLLPGDTYLITGALKYIMALALKEAKPPLVYSGTLLIADKGETRAIYYPLDWQSLSSGHSPTVIQGCFFRTDIFREVGKFNPQYKTRGGFDFFCRFLKYERFSHASTTRVMVTFDLRFVPLQLLWAYFWEGLQLVYRNFGLFATIKWLFVQRDLARFFRFWKKRH